MGLKRERGKGKVWVCSQEVEHTESSFLRAYLGRDFRGGHREGSQQNIHQLSRCAHSGFWSPLNGGCLGGASLVNAAGSELSSTLLVWFCSFPGPGCYPYGLMLKRVGLEGPPEESLEAILWLLVSPPRGFTAGPATCQERKDHGSVQTP